LEVKFDAEHPCHQNKLMPDSPSFSYYISPSDLRLSPADPVWREPLPLVRPTSGKSPKASVTHGEYFETIRSFFEQDGFHLLAGALSKRLNAEILPVDVGAIQVHLEKHGEFYHPARIVVDADHQQVVFVLNTAVTPAGKKLVEGEYPILKRLNSEFPGAYLPQVYGLGQIGSTGGIPFKMFLGEWLQGYHEFHISSESSDQLRRICVWDDRNGRYFLSADQMRAVYRGAAAILTYYYNVATFEHITQWHHAAGDFILKCRGDEVDLKLITVRRYSPLFRKSVARAAEDADAEQILQALLIFFLKLSFRMRLDRINGVGDLVWSDPGIVQSLVDGVMDGLSQKPDIAGLPDAVDTCFRYYLTVCSQSDLFELSDSILRTFTPEAPETRLIRQNLGGHVHLLHQAIKDLPPA
jgi:hypothetical protein